MERPPRAVPASHAFAWFGEAMRLWRASPGIFAALAAVTIGVELLLRLVPVAGVLLSQALVPLFECSLLYASLAADRDDKPRMRHLLAILGAPPRAQAAVIVASLVAFAGQALCASAFAGVDLLSPSAFDEPVSTLTLLAIVASGLVVSLPFTFVQPIALFDDTPFATAFNASLAGFARNIAPLCLYAGVSLVLFLFGIVTSGLGLLLALPWLAASSYAAWKDVFAVAGARA